MEFHLVSIILPACLVLSGFAIESPQYAVIQSESDFEIRPYGEALWLSALVQGSSFQNSTKAGFHRLYRYIHGANLNSALFAITAPVLTTTTDGSVSFVKIYLTAKSSPQPNSELNLQIEKWTSHCIAIRKFSGLAKDDNINQEAEALVNSLNKQFTRNTTIPEDKISYTIAQYEVWMSVSGFNAEGCQNYQGDDVKVHQGM